MANTKQIPHNEWKGYFEGLTRSFQASDTLEMVTLEVLSPQLGDQIQAETMRLQGITYDPRSNALEVWLEDLDHLAYEPREIWVMEDEGGFVSAVEIKRANGESEILYIRRGGPPARRYPTEEEAWRGHGR